MEKQVPIKKIAFASILIALGVACSAFSIPIGASRCLPTQHAVNVLAGVFLGPAYACGMAFLTSLIRFLMGTGSLLAFPGSMIGALLAGLAFQYGKRIWTAVLGEVFGTGILGALAACPVAVFLLGKESALFAYMIPFLISTAGGAVISACLLKAMEKARILQKIQNGLGGPAGYTQRPCEKQTR